MQLSNSILSVFKECKRCFWLDRNKKLLRPRGIFSSLPNAIDKIIKNKMDSYRGSLPPQFNLPELKGFRLYNGSDFKKMRNWATNPFKMKDLKGNIVVGAFDDLLHNPTTDEYAVADYKSKGTEPNLAYGEKYYQTQIDLYSRFLEVGGKKLAPFAVLFYFWSEPDKENLISFKTKALLLTPNTENAEKIFSDAIECLEGELPPPANDCKYCIYHQQLKGYDNESASTQNG